MNGNRVAVVMGSDSDLTALQPAIDLLKQFRVPHSVRILSAHRTPAAAAAFAESARSEGYGVLIAAAGKAAHLAGALASRTTLPVIGVPIESGNLGGLDALFSTVQMPTGVPVAAVAIGGASNAAILAVQILSIKDPGLTGALEAYRRSLEETVLAKDAAVQAAFSGSR